jgi:hypothetical protein
MEAKEMDFKVVDIFDNEDGSATLVLEMNNEAAHAFLSFGVLRALELGLEAQESEEESE